MSTDVLIIGTGQYVTGVLHGVETESDKSLGVVALVLFDLRRRGQIGRIILCGRDGRRFPAIRTHFQTQIAARYVGLDVSLETWPADDQYDAQAYHTALETLLPGSAVIIVTPDDIHVELAEAAMRRGMHVLVAKPLVKTLTEHYRLLAIAQQQGVLLATEMHKRFDPIYADARDRAPGFGDFSYFYSYMSQPRSQLETFRQWAGQASDISYYLNSHHVDWLIWTLMGLARPECVTANAATGVAVAHLGYPMEDTINLNVQWRNLASGSLAMSLHTASWIAPKSDVHSQQRFFYMGQQGELQVDQAHRGYSVAEESCGYVSPNPQFMKYLPSDNNFSGQNAYGYQSIERFIEATARYRTGQTDINDSALATADNTLQCTAILAAGRLSLDKGGLPVTIEYNSHTELVPKSVRLPNFTP